VVLQTRVRAVTRFRVLVVVVDRVCLFELFGELCLFEHFIARTRVILQHYYVILQQHYYVILQQRYYVIITLYYDNIITLLCAINKSTEQRAN